MRHKMRGCAAGCVAPARNSASRALATLVTGLRMAVRSALSLAQVPQEGTLLCCLVSGDALRCRADLVPEPVDVATATLGVW